MESGVRLLEKDLKDVLQDKVELRFYNVSGKSFHPKAYIFEYDNKHLDIFIGSSNISKSALILKAPLFLALAFLFAKSSSSE